MIKKILIALFLIASMIAPHAIEHATAGSYVCSYYCQQARYQIQVLQDRIWREQQKGQWINWDKINYWQQQINKLAQVR